MTCFKPLNAYKSLTKKTKNGKSYIAFKLSDAGVKYEHIQLPCGQCIGCRIDRSKQWAIRCVHEASLYSDNCFITLTYSEESLKDNPAKTLVKEHFTEFIRELRRNFKGSSYVEKNKKLIRPIRYFQCGEYGENLGRPHHHACIFNFDFPDKKLWSIRNGVRLYRSEILEKYWTHGYSTIGDVTFESAAYVAQYITKKVNGKMAKVYYNRIDKETGEMIPIEPEYITMSLRPGIASGWFERYGNEVHSKDYVTMHNRKFKPPKYYDKIYDEIDHQGLEAVKKQRKERAEQKPEEYTGKRLTQKEKVIRAKFNLSERTYENGKEDLFII